MTQEASESGAGGRPMTPQEALQQAIGHVSVIDDGDEWMAAADYACYIDGEGYPGVPNEEIIPNFAAAILDALRAIDADIITKSDHSTGMRLWTTAWEQGAQQERERLLAKAFPGLNVAQQFRCVDRSFFADPEDDR